MTDRSDDVSLAVGRRPVAQWACLIGAGLFGLLTTVSVFIAVQSASVVFGPEFLRENFFAGFEAGFQAGAEDGDGSPTKIDALAFMTMAFWSSAGASLLFGAALGGLLWLRDRIRHPNKPRAKGLLRLVRAALSVTEGAAWIYLAFIVLNVVLLGGLGLFSSTEEKAAFEAQIGMSLTSYLGLFAPTGFLVCGALLYAVRAIRAVSDSVAEGDPFATANGERLLRAGAALVAYQVLETGSWALFGNVVKAQLREVMAWFHSPHLWPGFFGLVLLVIGAAFREGARLREEQELTV